MILGLGPFALELGARGRCAGCVGLSWMQRCGVVVVVVVDLLSTVITIVIASMSIHTYRLFP